MTSKPLRRSFLRLAIVFLALTAAVALVSVLTGAMGELQARILGSSTTISLACVIAMACAAYRERGRHPRLADFGIGCAAVAATLMLVGIWAEIRVSDSELFWKSVFLTMIWAFACAHAQLLSLPTLQTAHRWTQHTAVAAIVTLTTIGSYAILIEIDAEWIARVLIALAIVVALFTLVVPILAKMRRADGATNATESERLVLMRGVDGVFRDALGIRYRVDRIDDGGGEG
jgi:hypothetical protein